MVSVSINHPSTFINKELLDVIRFHAAVAEQNKTLHPEQLAIIYDNKWFKMFVPAAYHGLEMSLPDVLKIEESISWADGSTGWVVTLCSGAEWFAGFIDTQLAGDTFMHKQACVAGSGAATGIASVVDQGYQIEGYWKYASGLNHATAITLNCLIQKDGKQLYEETGQPMIRSFILKPEAITPDLTWNAMGMIATGSHSFHVSATVNKNCSFLIQPTHATLPHPVYQYPFLQLAETTLTVNISGMTTRFLELCEPFMSTKKDTSPHLMQQLADAQTALNNSRNNFYSYVQSSWSELLAVNTISDVVLEEVSNASYTIVRLCMKLVTDLYPYCGLSAADVSQEINRVWRNIQTAHQHALFRRRN
jgi:hypothetical protein